MPISRPFSYNPTLQTEGVSEQLGTLSVGFTGQTYGNSPGGLKWWNGPDEELGYVIGTSLPTGGIPGPDGIIGDVTFWRTETLSSEEFILLANSITGQNFTTVNESITWLNSNGYWCSILTQSILFYLGGYFTSFSGESKNYINRLNTDGTSDSSFTIGNGFNSFVLSSLIQSDGKIIVGGGFTSYSGISCNRITRLNTDGSLDTSFVIGTGFNSTVRTTSIQSDEKIIVGGDFTTYSGISTNYIARLNTDGSLDTSFVIGTGFNSLIASSSIQSDGKIIVGGTFTTYSGISRNRIVRLNSDGSLDTSFNPKASLNSNVNTISIQSDGKIIIGGSFTSGFWENSIRASSILSNGEFDTSFVTGSGFNATIYSSSLQSDGKIVVGGEFTTYSGISRNGIARLNTDGSLDTSFVIGTGFNLNRVLTLSTQSDGKIVVGGQFTSYSGISRSYIARLNTDGSLDTSFVVGTGFNSSVNTLSIQSDGKIIAGGQFTSYSGISTNYIARLNTDGSLDTSFVIGTGFGGVVNSTLIQPDGKIIVGGGFTSYSGISCNRITRLNTDGSLDTSFVIGTGFNNNVKSISIQSDGKIIVGGDFTTYSGVSRNYIVRLNTDGSLDTSFVVGTGFNNAVTTLSIQSDGKIIVGGIFTTYSGISTNYIARLNTDGSYDSSFNSYGFNNIVYTTLIRPNGSIFVGGIFLTYNSLPINYLTRLNTNGSLDTSFVVGTGFNNNVNTTLLQSDGKIIVGGQFTTYSGISINRIARLNTDGSLDTSFVVGTGFNDVIRTSSIQSDGKIIVGGGFITYSGISSNRIARLNTDGSLDTSFVIGTGFSAVVNTTSIQSDGKIVVGGNYFTYKPIINNYITSITEYGVLNTSFVIGDGFNSFVESSSIQPDGKIIVGGQFTRYSGTSRNRIARLNTDGSLDTSFVVGNGFNGTVNNTSIQPDGKIIVGGGFNTYSGITTLNIAIINTDGTPDLSFNSINGFNGSVNTSSLQSDGKIIVGGSFTSYSGISINRIARLNTDGSLDTSFVVGTGFTGSVLVSSIQSDGKIVVGGDITSYSGISTNRIARLNTDGSLDTSFVIGTGFNSSVNTLSIQSDGKIIVGGDFTIYSESSINRIVRLNTDGSLDTSFVIGTGFGGVVNSTLIQPDGKIIVGGGFTSYSGISCNRITRLNTDGSLDTSFVIGTGFNNNVKSISIQSDGKIVIGGTFTEGFGYLYNKFGTLNLNGTQDLSFVIGQGFNGIVNSFAVQPDGKVVIVGGFTTYSGVSINRIVRLNTDGSLDTSFTVGTGFNNTVNTLSIQSDGKIIVGGAFSIYSGILRNRIARLNTDGSLDLSFVFGSGFDNVVYTSSIQSDGKIIVGGNFTSYNSILINRIARLNTDGSLDTSFTVGTGLNNIAYTSSIQSDGKIIIGGSFTYGLGKATSNLTIFNENGTLSSNINQTYFNSNVRVSSKLSDGKIIAGGAFTLYNNTILKYRIAKLNDDSSVDLSFNSGFNGDVLATSEQSDGKIIVGGSFTQYLIPTNRVIIINNNGSIDPTFTPGTGFNNFVYTSSIQSDGKIFVGGAFSSYSGTSSNTISRLNTDGSLDTSFTVGRGFNSSVFTSQIQTDGKILVGGDFTNGFGNSSVRVASISPNGDFDTSFVTGSGFGNVPATSSLQSDGKIIVGGFFSSYYGISINRIARLNTDGSLDASFIIGSGFNSTVNTTSIQSDGKIIAGGFFSSYSGISINRIARLNIDGSLDASFVVGTGFGGTVNSTSIQSDGKIIVGGDFTAYSGISRNRIVRLNTDGSLDTSFVIGTGFTGSVLVSSIQSDGKILVGGDFTAYSGISINRIARLNTDGSLDTSFVIGTGFNSTVRTISIQPDGKIMAGGDFTTYSGISTKNIVRLNTDGSLDTSFTVGTGFNNTVRTLAIQPDGKIVVGGNFTSYNSISNNRIVRLNTDGSLDTSFTVGTGFDNIVYTTLIRPNGSIFVGGDFTTYKSQTLPYLTRLNTNGSLDTSFNIGSGFNGRVSASSLQSDGKILVGGNFTSYSGISINRIARLNIDGSLDTSFVVGTGFNNSVYITSLQSDGKILVGGDFTSYSGISSNRIVRLNTNGSLDTSFIIGTGFIGSVLAFTVQSDGKILVGGNFTSYSGISINRIARLNIDGSLDTSFVVGTGFNNNVRTYSLQSDGKILVAGDFTSYSGISINRIARLNTDGSLDTSFVVGTGFNNSVHTFLIRSNGSIFIAGGFTDFKNTSINRIARLNIDGSLDASFVVGTGFGGTVNSTSIQSDGKIIVGGEFTSYSGISRNRIVRLNTDGSLDTSFVIGTGFGSTVNTTFIQSDGKIIAGGQFTSYSGISRNYIVRLNTDGSLDTSFVIGTGFNSFVNTGSIQSDGKIVVGGSFTTYSGISRSYIARLNADGSLDTSFTVGTGFNNTVRTTLNQSNGKIIVGGEFTTYSGISSNRIARLNTDGSLDTSFYGVIESGLVFTSTIGTNGEIFVGGSFTNTSSLISSLLRLNTNGSLDSSFVFLNGFGTSVLDTSIQSDGKIIVGGSFTTYSGISRNRIARLNTDGSLDTSFVIGSGFNNNVNTLAIQSDGKILVGGGFTSYSGVTANRLIRLNANGTYDFSQNLGGSNISILKIIASNSKIYLGGDFSYIRQLSYDGISRVNNDGSVDNSFNTVGLVGTPNMIKIIIRENGKIIVGGGFSSYLGYQRKNILQLNSDGSIDDSFNILNGFSDSVNNLSIKPDGKIIAVGGFTSYRTVLANSIARLNADGFYDLSFVTGVGFNSSVLTSITQPDGKIIAGGGFTSYSGISINRIARLNTDGSLDTSFVVGTGFSAAVNTTSIQSDGKIVVGGSFTTYSGISRNYISRLNTDGSLDTSFVIGTGFNNYVNTTSLQSDGKIIVGGGFTSYSGVSSNRIARLNTDGSLDTSFTVGTGFNADPITIITQSDGKIIVGGNFTSYNSILINRIARLNTDGSLDTSLNITPGFNNNIRTIVKTS